MGYQFTNNAQTTLAADLTAGATSLSVASASGFPASGDFTIVVGSEIMLVTGVAGTVFTVSRAQEGTSAAAHSSGATVQHVVTAAFLNAVGTKVADRVQRASGDVAVSSATFVDVTGMSITFTLARAARVVIGLVGTASHGTAGTGNYIDFTVDGVSLSGGADGEMRWMSPTNNCWVNISLTTQTGLLAAGSHTVVMRARVNSGGATYQAGGSQPLRMWVAEV